MRSPACRGTIFSCDVRNPGAEAFLCDRGNVREMELRGRVNLNPARY